MIVGISEAPELKARAEELKVAFPNLLRRLVLEDLLYRIYSGEYAEYLWLWEDYFLTEQQLQDEREQPIRFFYRKSDHKFTTDKIMPGHPLSEALTEDLLEQLEQPMRGSEVIWKRESHRAVNGCIGWQLAAEYRDMMVPVRVVIQAIEDDNQLPEKRSYEVVTLSSRTIDYYCYSVESRVSNDFYEIMEKLELIGDMGAYSRIYHALVTQPLSGRHMMELMEQHLEQAPKVKKLKRMEQLEGYRSYAYMRKRYEQYEKRHGEQSYDWEKVLDLIVAFAKPLWNCLCQNEVFFDDWMPELGRFM